MKIEIYSKDHCGHCTAAIQLAESRGFEPTVLKLDTDFNRDELLEKFPEARTFPQVTVEGEHVGGFLEFSRFLNSL